MELQNKVAVVTGGANGIGFANARLLAENGASVWILDLEREKPDEAARQIGGKGIAVDVSDRQAVDAAMAAVATPDVVIVAAGTVRFADFWEQTEADWDRIISVNLTGAFHTVQSAGRIMRERRRGAIVLIASTNSFDGESGLVAYNASKAGLLGLLHTSANELGPYGVRINAVCPGLIRTRLTASLFADQDASREYFRDIPLGRGGEPDEVAQACLFLASDRAAFITGATLFVDGGQMAGKVGTWSEKTAEFSDSRWRLR